MITKRVVCKTKDGEVFEGYTVAGKQKDGYYTMQIKGQPGLASFPEEEVESFEIGKVVPVQQMESVSVEIEKEVGTSVTVRQKSKRKSGEPSKAERAFELLKNEDLGNRKKCIEILMTELNMTPAGASTYHSNIKKKVKAQ